MTMTPNPDDAVGITPEAAATVGITPPPAPPERRAGKRGARESHEPRLLLSQFRSPAPSPFTEWDGSHGITQWGMDGNDEYGDCGPTATSNGNVAKANDPSLIDKLGDSTPLDLYFEYGVAMGEAASVADRPDMGVDNQSWLAFLYQRGIIDGYGEVPLDELERYAQDFNGLLLAIVLDADSEAEFQASPPIPWGGLPADATPDPSLGHDVWLIQTHADGSIGVITWAAIQQATPEFRQLNITDAWAILDEEDAKRTGTDWEALQAALRAVHGVDAAPGAHTASPAATGVLADAEHVVADLVTEAEHVEADVAHDAKEAYDEVRKLERQAVADIEKILADLHLKGASVTSVLLHLVEARGATIAGWLHKHL